MEVIMTTQLPLQLLRKGKVRETYRLNDAELLMVATDRLSAFDVVFNEGIPHKGIVLNMLSKFWFEKTSRMVRNHFVTAKLPETLPPYLKGRSMVVRAAEPIKIECVVRGYLTGSAWKEYQQRQSVCGIKLEGGIENGDRLEQPLFTPSTKAETGHDENISFEKAVELVGREAAEKIMEHSLALYKFGHDYAIKRGLVLADTKFEFGLIDNEIILIDELMTPDSSRYWLKEEYEKRNLVNMDKQYVRDYLERIGWDKNPPPPELPPDIINKTSKLYLQTYEMLAGMSVIEDIKKL